MPMLLRTPLYLPCECRRHFFRIPQGEALTGRGREGRRHLGERCCRRAPFHWQAAAFFFVSSLFLLLFLPQELTLLLHATSKVRRTIVRLPCVQLWRGGKRQRRNSSVWKRGERRCGGWTIALVHRRMVVRRTCGRRKRRMGRRPERYVLRTCDGRDGTGTVPFFAFFSCLLGLCSSPLYESRRVYQKRKWWGGWRGVVFVLLQHGKNHLPLFHFVCVIRAGLPAPVFTPWFTRVFHAMG